MSTDSGPGVRVYFDDEGNELSLDDLDNAHQEIPIDDCVNIFEVPPPPFVVKDPSDGSESHKIYTIVPGQIASAIRRRNMTPLTLYGGQFFMIGSEFADLDVWKIEESYYYKPYDEDYLYSDSSDEEDNEEPPAANEDGNGSDATQQFSIPAPAQPLPSSSTDKDNMSESLFATVK